MESMIEQTTHTDDVQATEATRPESLTAILERQRKEREAAFQSLQSEGRELGREMEASIRADASTAITAALQSVRQREAGGSVPTHMEYGSLLPEQKLQLDRLSRASGSDAPAVVVVPRPDRNSHQERRAWTIIDIKREVCG